MMTGFEASLLSASGKVLAAAFPKIIKKTEEVLAKRKGLEGYVDTLNSFLSILQSFILDNRKIIVRDDSDQTQRTWIANLRCLAYDMEDCLEGYRTKTIKADENLYDKITELKEKVVELNGFVHAFNRTPNPPPDQADASSSATTSSDLQRQHDRGFRLGDLLSKEKVFHELLDLVKKPDAQPGKNLKVTVISIVSFGRIGRTNLCKQVYRELRLCHTNNESGQKLFSEDPVISAAGKDETMVLEEIMGKIPKQPQAYRRFHFPRNFPSQDIARGNGGNVTENQKDMINELAERLGDNRYLIMVDDVESGAMAKFITTSFPENNVGSRIVMAMTVVGSTAECGQDNESVNQADEEDGRRDLFEIVESSSSTEGLLLLMKRGGVPLALIRISDVPIGIFNAENVEEAWKQRCKAEADRCRRNMNLVLPRIYDNLGTATSGSSYTPHPQPQGRWEYMNLYLPDLQACLLYFSMFPRDHDVKRGSLIRRWMAEGRELGGTGFHDADKNLNLVNQKFIRPIHVTLNNNQEQQHLKTCRPPGMVLDFIDGMSQQEAFIMLSCTQELAPNYIRRLSLRRTAAPGIGGRQRPTDDGHLPPRLRTLAVSRGTNARIAECMQLRVLDLGAYPGLKKSQLKDICKKLKLLKYLSLKPDHDSMKKVPKLIRKLELLETLDMGNDKEVQIPIEVMKLPCLKHLLGKFKLDPASKYWPVSDDIKESRLESIAGFVTSKGQGFPRLMCHMTRLWKVKIWFRPDADANCLKAYLPEAITKFLKNDGIDRTLSLDFQNCSNPGKLLESLAKASGKLYSLKLSGKNLTTINYSFVTKLTDIKKLCLSGWETIKLDATFLVKLSKLNQLKYLKLDAENIQGSYDENPGTGINQPKVVINDTHIKNLEQMCLVAKQTLPDIEIKHTALQRLVSLHLISENLHYCPSANIICKANGQATVPLMNLKEVSLNSTVPKHLRNPWHEAARDHPNRPQILFVQHPHRAG